MGHAERGDSLARPRAWTSTGCRSVRATTRIVSASTGASSRGRRPVPAPPASRSYHSALEVRTGQGRFSRDDPVWSTDAPDRTPGRPVRLPKTPAAMLAASTSDGAVSGCCWPSDSARTRSGRRGGMRTTTTTSSSVERTGTRSPPAGHQDLHELVKSAGVRPIRLHDLRHGRASLLLALASTSRWSRRCSATHPSRSPRTPTPTYSTESDARRQSRRRAHPAAAA